MRLNNIQVRRDFEREIKSLKQQRVFAILLVFVFLFSTWYYTRLNSMQTGTVYTEFTVYMPKNEINLINCRLRDFLGEKRSMWCDAGEVQMFPERVALGPLVRNHAEGA